MRAVGLDEPFFVARGEGAYVVTVDGNRYSTGSCRGARSSSATPIRRRSKRSARRRSAARASARRPRPRSSSRRRSSTRVPSIEKVRARLVRHRGDDERAPARARLHGATGSSSSTAATTATPTRCSRAPAPALATLGIPARAGVPRARPQDTIVVPYNDLDAVEPTRYAPRRRARRDHRRAGRRQHGRRPAGARLPRGRCASSRPSRRAARSSTR